MKIYPKKLFLPRLPKYGNLLLYTAKVEFFYFSFSKSKDSITTFQGTAQYLSEKIFVKINYKTCVLPLMPKYENLDLDMKKLKFLKFFSKNKKIQLLAFQRGLNHYLRRSFCQDILKNVFFASNAQIWKFGPRHGKN